MGGNDGRKLAFGWQLLVVMMVIANMIRNMCDLQYYMQIGEVLSTTIHVNDDVRLG